MKEMNFEDIVARLDLLQETVLSIDEKSRRNLESISKQQLDIADVKNSLALLKDKMEKIWAELSKLKRSKGGINHGTKRNYRRRNY